MGMILSLGVVITTGEAGDKLTRLQRINLARKAIAAGARKAQENQTQPMPVPEILFDGSLGWFQKGLYDGEGWFQ
jgi:hypothetical protein